MEPAKLCIARALSAGKIVTLRKICKDATSFCLPPRPRGLSNEMQENEVRWMDKEGKEHTRVCALDYPGGRWYAGRATVRLYPGALTLRLNNLCLMDDTYGRLLDHWYRCWIASKYQDIKLSPSKTILSSAKLRARFRGLPRFTPTLLTPE